MSTEFFITNSSFQSIFTYEINPEAQKGGKLVGTRDGAFLARRGIKEAGPPL